MTKVLKSRKLLLNGIFGVLKEKGDSIDDYMTWIRLTHYNENVLGDYQKKWTSPSLILDIKPWDLEPFATGVLCVGIGFWSTKLTALTQFWSHEWEVSARFGAQTLDYSSDSEVIQRKPFDHINEELLNENLKQFIGTKEQLNPPIISKESILTAKQKNKRTEPIVKENSSPRIRECHSIEVMEFKPPDIKLKVISGGYFSCRSLINDLGLKMNSCAHIRELHLNRMGVITPNQCLKKYEIHSKQIIEAIGKYSNLCSKDLKKFEELKTNNRRFI